MKSRRSVIRAILFMLRLQKSVTMSRDSRRSSRSASQPGTSSVVMTGEKPPSHHARFLSRAESTRHRRRSSQKQSSQHRNSAPGGALPHRSLRSPSFARLLRPHDAPTGPVHFGAFSAMSQPYSLGLTSARGTPILSVCAGAAHTLASTALLCRQQSLDEYATRSLASPVGPSSNRRQVPRQTSVEAIAKRRKNGEDDKKAIKSNMISLMSALIAVEQDDVSSLSAALKKGAIEAHSVVTCGAFANFETEWTLLDIALSLDSMKSAQCLIENGALSDKSLEERQQAVAEAVEVIDRKKRDLKQNTTSREFDKHVKQLISYSAMLARMEKTLSEMHAVELECVHIETSSSHSVLVRPKIAANQRAIVIKYQVEWSDTSSFDSILGSTIVTEGISEPFEVTDVDAGRYLSFRVSAGTIYGFDESTLCTPHVIEMSSWEELDGLRESTDDYLASILSLSDQVEKHRQSLVWQHVFPSPDNGLKRKRNGGIKELFVSSAKFAKNMQRGVYLAALIYCEGKVLVTVDDVLPCFAIDETICSLNKEDVQWLLKLSLGWDQLHSLAEATASSYANNVALSFRSKVMSAASDLMNALGLKDIGRLAQPVQHENVTFLVTVRFVTGVDAVTALTTHWMTFDKLLRKRISCSAMNKLVKETVTLMNFFESSQIPLKRGLYVSYLKLHSSLSSIRVVVPDNMPSVLPYVSVRENPHVTLDEWEFIRAIDENRDTQPKPSQRAFHRMLSKAINKLLHDLDVDPDLVPGHRMLTTEILQLNKDISLVLILPKPEDVCSAPTGSSHQTDAHEQRRGCTSISTTVFEMIHLCTYYPTFLSAYCKLSIFIEHFLMISQFELRKCMLEADIKVYRTQSEQLTEFQKALDLIWANSRWISRIASQARDKTAKCTIPLSRLLAPAVPPSGETSDGGYQSDQTDRPDPTNGGPSLSRFPRPQSLVGSPSLADFDKIVTLRRHRSTERFKNRPLLSSPLLSEEAESPTGSVVVIHAAYDCGMSKGTSIRLSIAPSTTSREVVCLVVEQLAKVSARVAGRRVETDVIPDADEYCLAVVIGVRERRLRDDFALLKLQNPWSKGKIFVRRKDSVCEAVKYGNEALV